MIDRSLKYNYIKLVLSICLVMTTFFSCKQKSIEPKMEGIEQQIINLTKLGITENCIIEGDSISKSFINNVKEFETNSGLENWIILREIGSFCNWKTKERNSNNVSTIIYDDFFFYFKISTIFSELNRISNNRFQYEIIDEFGSTYNSNDEPINQEFWKKIETEKAMENYLCKYKIMGEDYTFEYSFFKPNWTTLNPTFVNDLLLKLNAIFEKFEISHLDPEEFLTLVAIDKKSQMQLRNELNINLK